MSESVEHISHYRLMERIGRGAMGVVYRAVDERLGRAVALKLLPRKLEASADMQARLLREAQAASSLNHPGIVTVHDIGAWQGRLFIVMELIDGERLSDLARGGVSVEEALRLCADAADALGAAHARGILHRDVKSDNLMRTRDGRVKVLDFGLAKLRAGDAVPGTGPITLAEPAPAPVEEPAPPAPALAATMASPTEVPAPSDRTRPGGLAGLFEDAHSSASAPVLSPSNTLTAMGSLIGTPAYMAPEQTYGGAGDGQCEVFSLGVVLYELVTGRRPFDRLTVDETLEAIRSADLIPPSQAAPERAIPRAVDELVLRAMERDRAKRFQGMNEFAKAMRLALAPPSTSLRVGRSLVTVTAGLTLVLLVVGITGWSLLLRRAPAPGVAATVRSTRRITFDPGCEEYPSFTPDGRTLIFDGLSDGDYEVMALDLEHQAVRRLTHSPGWDFGAAVSPDGKSIGYIHMTDGGRELRVMNAEGDAKVPHRELGLVFGFPAWTPDGALLAGIGGDRVFRFETDPGHRQEVAKLPQGRILRYLATYRDGDLVAIRQTGSQALELVLGELPRGGEPREIEARLPYSQTGLAVSPSQDGFYYARLRGAASELIRISRRGGPSEVVPGGIAPSSGFSLSSDGKQLAYSTCRETIVLARLRPGAPPVELMPRGGWRDHFPAAIDRQHVLFTSDRSGENQVWQIDLSTGETRPFAGPDTAIASVSFDRSIVAYADGAAGGIHVKPIAGGPARRVTQDPADAEPHFSHDGRQIAFQRTGNSEGTRIYAVALDGGAPRPITPVGSLYPAFSPIEDRLVFLQPGEAGKRLMQTDFQGSAPRPVLADLPPGDYTVPRFSTDGKRLLLVNKLTEVIELTLDGSAPPAVRWKAGKDGIESVDYAPDGDGFIASLEVWDGDLWLAEGEFR